VSAKWSRTSLPDWAAGDVVRLTARRVSQGDRVAEWPPGTEFRFAGWEVANNGTRTGKAVVQTFDTARLRLKFARCDLAWVRFGGGGGDGPRTPPAASAAKAA
jgi:hypothetical protein